MVHDFTWAADKEYIHDIVQVPNGATLHFLYKNNPKIIDNWKKVQPETVKLMQFYNQIVGKYPYESIFGNSRWRWWYGICHVHT